jgi:2-amino-4-hydroxy-6-hydroxymethyldihydropteridine diphosphokinase
MPFDVADALDEVERTLHDPRTALVALGSNLGNRLELLQGAVDALGETPALRVKAVSGVFETDPVGGPDGQGSYFNAVVLLRTTLPPSSLLERGNAVEDAFNRTREVRWGARTLDVDILSYEGVVSDDPRLTLPHPRAHERAFVLAPWLDVDPAGEVPGRGTVSELLAGLDASGVHRRPDLALHMPQ